MILPSLEVALAHTGNIGHTLLCCIFLIIQIIKVVTLKSTSNRTLQLHYDIILITSWFGLYMMKST